MSGGRPGDAAVAVPAPVTPWQCLDGSGRNTTIPAGSGLYWVRRSDTREVLYIGQTGGSLRERLGSIAGAFRDVMPYNDPHTAAPAIWAYRHRDGCDFEAAVMPTDADVQHRKALESVAIWAQRDATGRSPAINFGGMPVGYVKSSQNNRRLVEQGKRFRGGPDSQCSPAVPSAPCRSGLDRVVTGDAWANLPWSPWTAIDERAAAQIGVYRIRRAAEQAFLVYIGQGSISARLRAHRAKSRQIDHRQAAHFSGAVEVSYAPLDVPSRTLLEVENDLIAAHTIQVGGPPTAQFLG